MYNKVLLPVAALVGVSLAQTFSADTSACAASRSLFIAGAPTPAAALSPYLDGPIGGGHGATGTSTYAQTTLPPDTLEDPQGYVAVLCSVAADLPSSLLPDFQSWGQGLLKYGSSHISAYDAFITECVTTGQEASTKISYLNSILTGTGALCAPTSAAGTTTASASYPVATPSGNNSTSTSATLIPTAAAAARPTGVLAGAAALGGLIGAVALM